MRVWKKHFSVFRKFLSDEVETIFWESEAKHSTLFKSKFGRKSFLENGFEAILSSKTSFVCIWKEYFSVFCRFLSDEVETIFRELEVKRSKLFQSKFGTRKLLRKWFWSYLELRNKSCVCLKRAFLSFLQLFEWRSWNDFLGKWDKAFKTI